MIVFSLMALLAIATCVALWHTVAVINKMGPRTNNGVRFAYVFKATGYFLLILACFDYLHGDPIAWPWLLLSGIAMANGGVALLHFVTRRTCQCPECPMRRQFLPCKEVRRGT